jgi:hypothetical protein
LLRTRDAIFSIIGFLYTRGHRSPWREWVHRPQTAGIGKCGERVVVATCWVGFRYYFGRDEMAERITLCLVQRLVFTLEDSLVFPSLLFRVDLTKYPVALKAIL